MALGAVAKVLAALRHGTGAHMQFIRYCLVGLVNTSLTLTTFILLKMAGVHYTLYSPIGYALGFISSYLLNRAFTFKASGKKMLRAFILVNGALFLAIQGAQSAVIESLKWPDLPVAIGFIGVYTICGFALNRWLFSRNSA